MTYLICKVVTAATNAFWDALCASTDYQRIVACVRLEIYVHITTDTQI